MCGENLQLWDNVFKTMDDFFLRKITTASLIQEIMTSLIPGRCYIAGEYDSKDIRCVACGTFSYQPVDAHSSCASGHAHKSTRVSYVNSRHDVTLSVCPPLCSLKAPADFSRPHLGIRTPCLACSRVHPLQFDGCPHFRAISRPLP